MDATREDVYAVIDQERDYQDSRFGDGEGTGARSLDEFILYINASAGKLANSTVSYASSKDKLHALRKIAALCVHAMEQHGVVYR